MSASAPSKPPVLISVVGASSSGKTALVRNIAKRFKRCELAVVTEDHYYHDQSNLSFEQRLKTNYDHPDSMDHELLLSHLDSLCAGQAIEAPVYDYAQHTRGSQTERIEPAPVIVVEGILLYTNRELRQRFDLKLYVDTPMDICLLRRVKRDVNERGRDVDGILAQYESTVRPMFLQFIEPSKRYADLIVPMGGHNQTMLAVMESRVQSLLQR